MNTMSNTTRRALLKTMAAIPVATATPLALQLLGMSNAAAQTADDYKALVCVFLFGGNDHYNTVIPYDTTNYNLYRNIRGGENWVDYPNYSGIAIKSRALLDSTALSSTTGLTGGGLQMALDPNMTGMKALFDAGRVGIVLNSGPLIRPTTLTEYNNKSVPLPPKLFSHNDQQAYTQSANLTEGAASGWGGRAADLILSQNTNSALTCISLTGNVVYLAGSQAISYQVSPTYGPMTVNAIKNNSLYQSNAARNALDTLVRQTRTHVLENEYRNIMQRSLNTHGTLAGAIGATPAASTLTNLFSSANSNTLSAQLRMVARVMEQRSTLGLKRQVFIVGMGGFDNHDFLPRNHGVLLQRVSAAFTEFDAALGHLGLRDAVTTFTASDFGRTLANNGDGSDHGWGGHYFVMGGKVNGNRFFGTAPEIGLTHNQQVGSGRLLPSTANDQVSAELARWFGVSDSNMSTVLPNSGNFNLHQLGLMKPT